MEQELIPKLFSGQPGKYLIFTQATRGHVALFQEEKERARGGKACGVNGFARDRAGYAPAPPGGGAGQWGLRNELRPASSGVLPPSSPRVGVTVQTDRLKCDRR